MAPMSRTYGEGFAGGFSKFQQTQEFWDVTVTTASGDWKLHSLLLASRSEFFYRALAGQFSESKSKVIELHLEKSEEVWPLLVAYFYTDSITISESNVCALLALSRQLLVSSVDAYCLEFVEAHLSTHNCLSYLRQAVRYNITDIQARAVTLAAKGFHLLYDSDTSGLPAATVLEVLRHEALLVHCEQQVMRFVLRYLSTTVVEQKDVEAICGEVRFLYLDNKLLASLRHSPQLPQELLLAGALQRLECMDTPGLSLQTVQPPPRATYCCDGLYALPGGRTTLTVQLEDIWAHVAPLCTVQVSGVSEGRPDNVLSSDPEAWFETDESSDPMPWIQISLPPNVRMVQTSRYVFSHGHRRSGYYRLRNWATLTADSADGPFHKINARPGVNEGFEVNVAKQDQDTPWRAIRLVGTDRQEDAVFRMCVRNLRLYGRAEVDLMRQDAPQALELTHRLVQQIKASAELRSASLTLGALPGGASSSSRRASADAVPGAAAAAAAAGGPAAAAAAAAAAMAAGANGAAALVPINMNARFAVPGMHHPAAVGGGLLA